MPMMRWLRSTDRMAQRVQMSPLNSDTSDPEGFAACPAGREIQDRVMKRMRPSLSRRIVSTCAQKCRSPTVSPVSSSSSRRAAASHDSPRSCAPPGSVSFPRSRFAAAAEQHLIAFDDHDSNADHGGSDIRGRSWFGWLFLGGFQVSAVPALRSSIDGTSALSFHAPVSKPRERVWR